MRAAKARGVRLRPNRRCKCACKSQPIVFNQCRRSGTLRSASKTLIERPHAMCNKSMLEGNQVMREFTLQATLIATIRVKAETRAEAEQKLHSVLAASDESRDVG